MSIVRVGATKKYSDNWENIFSGGRSVTKKSATKPTKKSPKKAAKPSAKKAAKKSHAGKKRKRK